MLAGQAPFSHNFAPFLDARPGIPPEQRFKALAGTSERGLFGFVSADGLRWRKLGETPLITKGAFDSQNVAFWSASEQCYALYLRTWSGGGFAGFRTISRATSLDFLEWSAPEEMSFGDTRCTMRICIPCASARKLTLPQTLIRCHPLAHSSLERLLQLR